MSQEKQLPMSWVNQSKRMALTIASNYAAHICYPIQGDEFVNELEKLLNEAYLYGVNDK